MIEVLTQTGLLLFIGFLFVYALDVVADQIRERREKREAK